LNLRQHVEPLTSNAGVGSICHWQPVFKMNKMPVRQARSSEGGRPPLGRGGRAGSSGWIMSHNSSSTSSWTMPASLPHVQLLQLSARFQVLKQLLNREMAMVQ